MSHICQMRLCGTGSFWNARISETEVTYKVSLFMSRAELVDVNQGVLYTCIHHRLMFVD